jgi:hypothetical protein
LAVVGNVGLLSLWQFNEWAPKNRIVGQGSAQELQSPSDAQPGFRDQTWCTDNPSPCSDARVSKGLVIGGDGMTYCRPNPIGPNDEIALEGTSIVEVNRRAIFGGAHIDATGTEDDRDTFN